MPSAAKGTFVSVAAVRGHGSPAAFVAAQRIVSVTSHVSSVKGVGTLFEFSRSFVEQCLLRRLGMELVAFIVRFTRALRAGVLRRAVSLWGRVAASVFRATITPQSSGGKVVFGIANASVVAFSAQRPNPSVERTSNSGLRPLSAAAHVKR